jgi:sulfate permease, SulP family
MNSQPRQNPEVKNQTPGKFSLFQGLLPLNKVNLSTDIIAGITLAALGIPEVMGYTKIIGMPVITGLYTILLPLIVFAIFGSSRHLVVGGDSATAAMVASAFAMFSFMVYSPKYVAMASLVGLIVGGLLIIARLMRFGFLADFLSRTVLIGFLSGVGIQVALSQLHGLLGFEVGRSDLYSQLNETLHHLSDTNMYSLFISSAVILIIIFFERYFPKIPGALIAIMGTITASLIFHWGDLGIRLVGEVPGGLPDLGFPNVAMSDVVSILPIAFSCFIVIIAQSAATSRAYAIKYHENLDLNRDLVGLSFASLSAGISGTFVINGSPTKTAMLDTAGGRSQVSHLTAATFVLLVLLFLTKPLSSLPDAVLASIVFLIGIKLIDYKALRNIYLKAPNEFALSLLTTLIVVFVGVEEGIILAMFLSLLQHVYYNYKPQTGVVIHDRVDHWDIVKLETEQMIEPGLMIFWFGSDLFYANSSHFSEEAMRLVENSQQPVKWFIIDCTSISTIDYSSALVLVELKQQFDKRGIKLGLTRFNKMNREKFISLGVLKELDPKMIFNTRRECLEAYNSLFSK